MTRRCTLRHNRKLTSKDGVKVLLTIDTGTIFQDLGISRSVRIGYFESEHTPTAMDAIVNADTIYTNMRQREGRVCREHSSTGVSITHV